jgi:exopolysaccharide production protein ExoZ
MKSAESPQRHSLASLQVFRGLAAIWVLIFHVGAIFKLRLDYPYFIGQSPFVLAGGHAVIFFFVLSGFVIMYVHRKHLGDPSNIRPYLARRISRIYPLVFVVVLMKLAYSFTAGGVDSSKLTPGTIASSLLLLPSPDYVIDVQWTLVFEIVFYFLFAVAIACGRKTALIAGILWALLIIGRRMAGCSLHYDNFIETVGHPFCLLFLAGAACAEIASNPRLLARLGWMWIPGVALMAFLIWGLGVIQSLFSHPLASDFVCILLWGASSAMIILSAVSLEYRGKLRWPGWLCVPGEASYSIYLVHTSVMMVMVALMRRVNLMPASQPVIILSAFTVVSLALSLAFWKWVEVPVMEWWNRRIRPLLSGNRTAPRPVETIGSLP